jgi:hypothetical protein
MNPVGTAFVVESQSCRLLLTAFHCLQAGGPFLLVKSITNNEDGSTTIDPPTPIPVDIIRSDPVGDIAILRANIQFLRSIPLCPPEQYPTTENEDVVKSYHCPITMFLDGQMESIFVISTSLTKLQGKTRHHMFVTGEHMRGSSGGVVVDSMGRAVGLICSGYIPGIIIPGAFSTLNTVWETITALSDGTAGFTKAVQLKEIYNLQNTLATN